jgi:tetratricopeptide (TPR) repeat protein
MLHFNIRWWAGDLAPLDLPQVLSKSKARSDKQTAIELFRGLLASHMYRMDALYALGECHYSLGEYETARNYSEELLRQNPDSSQVNTRYYP